MPIPMFPAAASSVNFGSSNHIAHVVHIRYNVVERWSNVINWIVHIARYWLGSWYLVFPKVLKRFSLTVNKSTSVIKLEV